MPDTNLSLESSAPTPLIAPAKTSSIYFAPGHAGHRRKQQVQLHDVGKTAGQYGVRAVVALLSYGGYRIREVLNLTWRDVLPGDRVIVRALKRGTSSIAHLPGCSTAVLHVPPSSMDSPIFACSYIQVYTHMLRTGWGMQKQGRIVRSVTHTPRNQLARTIVDLAGRAVASNLLHHINSNSLTFYVPPVPARWMILTVVVEHVGNYCRFTHRIETNVPGCCNLWGLQFWYHGDRWYRAYVQYTCPHERVTSCQSPQPDNCMVYPYWLNGFCFPFECDWHFMYGQTGCCRIQTTITMEGTFTLPLVSLN